MEIVENTIGDPLADVLDRRLFCMLGTVSEAGDPRVSPLWYLWEDGAMWILGDAAGKSYVERVRVHPHVAVALVDWDPAMGTVHHVGIRGEARIDPYDPPRADRLLARYLGDNPDAWDPHFRDLDPDRWRFIRIVPTSVVLRDQSYAPAE